MPKVFISYSHDTDEHKEKVLNLSNRLRNGGIDCNIDQYETSPPDGWPMWMDKQLSISDFVLIVFTRTYYKRVIGEEEEGKGLGVKLESKLTYQHLYENDSLNTRFIPILFNKTDSHFIPTLFKSATYYLLDNEDGYESLYRRLTNNPKVKKPELGKIIDFDDPKNESNINRVTTSEFNNASPNQSFSSAISEERKKQLEDHLKQAYELLSEYEKKRRLSSDPREKARCKSEIEEIKQTIQEYNRELAQS